MAARGNLVDSCEASVFRVTRARSAEISGEQGTRPAPPFSRWSARPGRPGQLPTQDPQVGRVREGDDPGWSSNRNPCWLVFIVERANVQEAPDVRPGVATGPGGLPATKATSFPSH